jgi:lipopolysaccharide export system permease protein
VEIVPLGVPMACLVGVVFSLSHAVRFREITAVRCGGIPLQSALVPILTASLAIAALIGLFEDRVIIPSRLADLEGGEGGAEDHAPHQAGGRWWYSTGRLIFSAGDYESESRTLLDVTMFELDASRSVGRRIDAMSALSVEGNTWEFRQARIRTFGSTGGLELQTSASLRVDLGVSAADLERAAPPAPATSLHKLARRIREFAGNPADLLLLEASFHERLARPLAALILVLLAIPFAIGDVERGDSLPRALLRSVIAAGIFWVLWTFAMLAARSGTLPPGLPIWGAIVLFCGLGAWRFRLISE